MKHKGPETNPDWSNDLLSEVLQYALLGHPVDMKKANYLVYNQGVTVLRRETSEEKCDVQLEATCWRWDDSETQHWLPFNIEEELQWRE